MRRRSALLVLAALVVLPVPATRGVEPPATTPAPSASVPAEPSVEPSAEPDAPPAPSSPLPSVGPAAPEPSSERTATPLPAGPSPAPTGAASPPSSEIATLDVTGRYIVVLQDGSNPITVRNRHAQRAGLRAEHVFDRAISGFAGRLTAAQVTALRADPTVRAVVPDEIIELAAQTIPTGVSRIGARSSSVARIDGVDHRVDADVAVVDTGIDPSHPDLNVVGGVNCSTSDRSAWRDRQSHGTHVAGTIGAIDNGSGVVGVAPGVRLWAVKILNDEGTGLLSWYVCGLDWIAAQRDPKDPSRPLIEAVNMSVAKWGSDDNACGQTNKDILHQAICRVTTAGVTVVAAAANDSGLASKRVPAAYNEVITVSALADTDGRAGGLGGSRCWSWGTYDVDDTFADFSNYGSDVDLIAPGKCIWSSLPGNRYGYSSGTSMAAPAVTGAVALYKASRPWMRPGPVKGALVALGNTGWRVSSDPDTKHERLLDVSRLGPAGDFSVDVPDIVAIGEQGGTISVPVTLKRSATHFEPVQLSASVPDGLRTAFTRYTLVGFSGAAATTSTLRVTVPAGLPAGRYAVTVTADETSRKRRATVDVVVESDPPRAFAPSAAPSYQSALGETTVPLRVTWPAAQDATSGIAGYEIQHSMDWTGWTGTIAVGGRTTSIVRSLPAGHGYAFRVRARDGAGNWSSWVPGAAVRIGVVDSASSAMRYGSGWQRLTSGWAWSDTLSRTGRTGASVTLTASARAIAIVAPVGPTQGWFRIFVNGVDQGRISMWASVGSSRRVLWVRTFPDGLKRIELRAERSSSRPRADLDAIVIQR